jgi:hypothetical protein
MVWSNCLSKRRNFVQHTYPAAYLIVQQADAEDNAQDAATKAYKVMLDESGMTGAHLRRAVLARIRWKAMPSASACGVIS